MIKNTQHTERLGPSAADIERAAQHLRAGRLVAFATETVYGLGADATNGAAVASLYATKGRPSFNPLIAHVASVEAAQALVQWNAQAARLAQAFWPGPLTMVLPLKATGAGISSLVTAGLQTLAVRVPAQPTARALLAAVGGPVAAPSANPSGKISPTSAAHVASGLDGRIAAIVDDGPCGVGVESTIVGLAGTEPMLLRPGGIAAEEIAAVLGQPLADRATTEPLTAPGQLLSHYAPNAPVRLNVTEPREGELFLGFGPGACDLNLSPGGNLIEAAARLFDCLHRLDAQARPIAVAPIPTQGLGAAINDRLQRAAAPRE